MATNLVIEAPDFDRVRRGDARATEDAVRLLWYALNTLSARETTDITTAINILSPLVQSDGTTSNQDNYDGGQGSVLLFTGAVNFNLTGIRNGVSGRCFLIVNLGAGTITVKHDTTSDTLNKIEMAASADKALATNKCMWLVYLNSRWREVSLA